MAYLSLVKRFIHPSFGVSLSTNLPLFIYVLLFLSILWCFVFQWYGSRLSKQRVCWKNCGKKRIPIHHWIRIWCPNAWEHKTFTSYNLIIIYVFHVFHREMFIQTWIRPHENLSDLHFPCNLSSSLLYANFESHEHGNNLHFPHIWRMFYERIIGNFASVFRTKEKSGKKVTSSHL